MRRKSIAFVATLLLLSGLVSGCTIRRGLDNYAQWMRGQGLTDLSGPKQSTGSITSGFDKRAEASGRLPGAATDADLSGLGASLETFMAGDPGFKEAHFDVSIGRHEVTLSGRKPENDAVIAAYRALRADPHALAIDLTRGWRPNGLTEDVSTEVEITYDTAVAAGARLAETTSVLLPLGAEVQMTLRAEEAEPDAVALADDLYAVSPATAAALAPA